MLVFVSLLYQTGVQDYEIFNDQLDSLGGWIIEAEEALKVQDPSGSTDLTVIQDRMEELKVVLCFLFSVFSLWKESTLLIAGMEKLNNYLNFIFFLPCPSTETHVEIQQYVP